MDEQLSRLAGYLKADPDNRRLRADVFDVALRSGDFVTAEQQTRWVLSHQPADFDWRHRLAMLDLARGESAEAVLLLKSLVDEGFATPEVEYNLAYAQFANGEFAPATERLERLVRSQRNDVPQALALLLRCLHSAGELDRGLQVFAEYGTAGADAAALGAASLIAVDAGHMKQAGEWADAALAQDAAQHQALVARGTAAIGARDVQTALTRLTSASRLHPKDGRTLSALGMAQLITLDLAASRQTLERATRAMPQHIGTWIVLGWSQVLGKDVRAARASFEAALQLDQNFAESHGCLAVTLALEGDAKQAETEMRRALGLDPICLSARLAQMLLNGDIHDADRYERLARRVLGQHVDGEGRSLADIVFARRTG